MDRPSTWLLDFQRNVYSQTGEDGIIDKILEVIHQKDKWCVEFGAWDGLHLSNVRNLIDSQGYSAVLIEPDPNRFRDLQNNYSQRDQVIAINKFVGFAEEGNLDQILSTTPIPRDFDFLSIDIDGNDYHVWNAIKKYRPKALVIEFNPTIPTNIRFVQPADPIINHGASILSLVELGKEKNYELVSLLQFNAFFVDKKYYPLFGIAANAPEILRTNLDAITYIFSAQDGTIFLRGDCKLPWHGVELTESKMQRLPRFLRVDAARYTKFLIKMLGLYLFITEPSIFFKKMRKRLDRLKSRLS